MGAPDERCDRDYQPGSHGRLRAQMGEDVRWFMQNGTGIGVSTGVIRNTGATPRWSDPVRIASFPHWPVETQRAHVLRYSPQWTEAELAEFAKRNDMSFDLIASWIAPTLPQSEERAS